MINTYRLSPFSHLKGAICALLKNDSPNHFYLRLVARLEPRHSRLQISSVVLIFGCNRKHPQKSVGVFYGPPEEIWTPVLRNRNPLRYPAAPRADRCSIIPNRFIIHKPRRIIKYRERIRPSFYCKEISDQNHSRKNSGIHYEKFSDFRKNCWQKLSVMLLYLSTKKGAG